MEKMRPDPDGEKYKISGEELEKILNEKEPEETEIIKPEGAERKISHAGEAGFSAEAVKRLAAEKEKGEFWFSVKHGKISRLPASVDIIDKTPSRGEILLKATEKGGIIDAKTNEKARPITLAQAKIALQTHLSKEQPKN